MTTLQEKIRKDGEEISKEMEKNLKILTDMKEAADKALKAYIENMNKELDTMEAKIRGITVEELHESRKSWLTKLMDKFKRLFG